MFQIETAGLVIRIENRFDNVRKQCAAYITPPDRRPNFAVRVTDAELRRVTAGAPGPAFSEGFAESIAVYEKIGGALPAFDAFVMHAAVAAVDGWAYAFAAESGTGKSTHVRHWKEALGDRVTIINGDKPICRFAGGQLRAYGTPWCGKERWQTDTSAPLRALCLLERGEENGVWPADGFRVLPELTRHLYFPGGGAHALRLIDRMLTTVPVYRLRCRDELQAARTAIAYFGIRTDGEAGQ